MRDASASVQIPAFRCGRGQDMHLSAEKVELHGQITSQGKMSSYLRWLDFKSKYVYQKMDICHIAYHLVGGLLGSSLYIYIHEAIFVLQTTSFS